MTIANYADLVQAIQDFANRTDIANEVASYFIQLAEAKFNRTIRSRLMIATTTLRATAGARSVAAPADMLEPEYLAWSPTSPIQQKSLEDVERLRRFRLRRAGTPLCYALNGSSIELAPIPSAAGSIELDYYQKIPALTSANPTNWLMTNDPDLYLNECLAITAQFLRDPDALTANSSLAGTSAASINALDARATMGADITPAPAAPAS
ncbi:MAG: phage adaptor protein [Caulobacteraceae bacterium]